MTYNNPELLTQLNQQYSDVTIRLGPHQCPHCDSNIPYSTDLVSWWCFECQLYSYDKPGYTAEHCCTMKVFFDGDYVRHMQCGKCGRVVSYDKFGAPDETEKIALAKYVHSLEFAIESHLQWLPITQKHETAAREWYERS